MKKKNLLAYVLAVIVALPVLFLTACGKEVTPKGIVVEMANAEVYVLSNDTLTFVYGTEIELSSEDFVVKQKYSDGSTKTLTEKTEETDGYTFESTIPAEVVAGSYALTFTYGSFTKTINVIVEKAKIDLSEVAWNYTEALTYSGEEQTVALTGLPQGVEVSYDGEASAISATNAGTYSAVAVLSYDTANYELINVPELSLTWEIKKAELDLSDVSWNYLSEFTYSNEQKSVTLTGLPAEVTVSYTGNSATNAGSYTATATLSYDTANYEIKNAPELSLDWKINKADYDLSEVSWNYSEPLEYDGLAKEIALIGLPVGVDVVEYAGNAAVEKGTYTATVVLTQADTLNYNIVDSSQFTITWQID